MSLLSKLGPLSVLPLGLALASAGCLAPSAASEDTDRTGTAVAADGDDGSVAPPVAPPAQVGGYVMPGYELPSGSIPTAGQYVGGLPGGYGGSLQSTVALPGALPGAFPGSLPPGYGTIPGAYSGSFGTSFPPAGSFQGGFPSSLPGVYGGGTMSAFPSQYQGLGNSWMDQGGQFPHWGWDGEATPLAYGDWSGPGFPRYPEGGTAWGSYPANALGAPNGTGQ